MNTAKKKYQKQCKIKTVTFYKTADDQELYKRAQSVNFQKFVKEMLRELDKYAKYTRGSDNGNIQDN